MGKKKRQTHGLAQHRNCLVIESVADVDRPARGNFNCWSVFSVFFGRHTPVLVCVQRAFDEADLFSARLPSCPFPLLSLSSSERTRMSAYPTQPTQPMQQTQPTQQQQQQQQLHDKPVCPVYLADASMHHQCGDNGPREDHCRGVCIQAGSKSTELTCMNLFLSGAANGRFPLTYLANSIYTYFHRGEVYAERLRKADRIVKLYEERERAYAIYTQSLKSKAVLFHDTAADLARRLHAVAPMRCTVCTGSVTTDDIMPNTLVSVLPAAHASRGVAVLPVVSQAPQVYSNCSCCTQTVHVRRECSRVLFYPGNKDARICMRCFDLNSSNRGIYLSESHKPTATQVELREMEKQMRVAYEAEMRETASLSMHPKPLGAWDSQMYREALPVQDPTEDDPMPRS
jgi:hypothetical protein